MISNKDSIFETLGELKEFCLEYGKYIVTEQQIKLIKDINDEIEDLNEDIWVNRYKTDICPIELETIMLGSFEGEDIFEILSEHGCDYSDELTVFESFNLKYQTLTKLNENIIKHGLHIEYITHNFW
jgi:hypothetical protein